MTAYNSPNTTKKNICFLCKKKFSLDMLYYCFCDIVVCQDCISKHCQKADYWVCPNCQMELKIADSKLIRTD